MHYRNSLSCISALCVAFASSGSVGGDPVRNSSGEGAQHLPPAGVSQDWWTGVQDDIARSEYAITPFGGTADSAVDEGFEGYQAPNRAQNFCTSFTAEGIRVFQRTSRRDDPPAWEWGLTLLGWGREGAPRAPSIDAPEIRVDENRIEYWHEGIVEWYVNDARGLEQGFTIESKPEAEGLVCLTMLVSGNVAPTLSEGGQAVDYLAEGGARVIRFDNLHAEDARGRALATWFETPAPSSDTRMLSIVVDDLGAEYPITIDPLATNPAWTLDADQADAGLGVSVATAGDVNGDGYSDVIVGAHLYDNVEADEGRVWVFHGSAAGLGATAAWTAESDQAGARFGVAAITADDVNGDGFSDVIIGARYYDNGQEDEGAAFVWYGGSAGLGDPGTPSNADWMAEGDQIQANLGYSVSPAGDVDGDGHGDVIIGARDYDNPHGNEGAAFVWHGGPAGLGDAGTPANADWMAESNQDSANFGFAVALAGDVNGDGYSDVIVGARQYDNPTLDEGAAFAWYGGPSGLGAFGNPSNADWTVDSNQANANFGYSVAPAGDVNGDGYADVLVGAPYFDFGQTDEGRAFLYLGSSTGLSSVFDWKAESNQVDAWLGHCVAPAGDVNADGYADVMVTALQYSNGEAREGGAFVWHGSSTGLGIDSTPSSSDGRVEGNQADAWLGFSVATAGDVNGDGVSDVIVGAYYFDNPENNEGQARVYHGSNAGMTETSYFFAQGNQTDAALGTSVAAAGDVNGDGYMDVIIGAPGYDHGQSNEGRALVHHGSSAGIDVTPGWVAEGDQSNAGFGISVASAGDVNGDGYSDVIVGASTYDNGQTDEGRAFVYHGSAAGLEPNPAWTADGDQADAWFGRCVATAGDVNGDGYSDVIVGANLYENNQGQEGWAFVYHGSSAGLSALPAWTGQPNRPAAFFGTSVATAGDLNGDSFSDVIIGAPGLTNGEVSEGAAFVYYGSTAGLAATAAWTAESNQMNAMFGSAVASAGDVNGDGYSDAVVTASQYDNGHLDEGRAFVYHGSAAGLDLSESWTGETDVAGAEMSSGATAGDVNGDGFSDVVVGSPLYFDGFFGCALVFSGSENGLSSGPGWTLAAAGVGDHFGHSVASAGDVNGDGHADIITGAHGFEFDQQDEGVTFLNYGGVARPEALPVPGALLRQLRTDGLTPIAPLGWSDSETEFRMRGGLHSIYGRTRMQLEHEVKPFGVPLDGANTARESFEDSGPDARYDFDQLAAGLIPGAQYHWRVRGWYDPVKTPFQPHGSWIHMANNGWNEADLRTGGVWSPPPDTWTSSWEAGSGAYPDDGCPWVLSNDADTEAPVLADGLLTLSTSENTENMYYIQTTDLAIPADVFFITARMRVAFETHTTGNPRRGVSISFTVAPDRANFLWFGVDEIFLWSANGVQGPTAFVDTDNVAHVYTIRVLNRSAITVYQDGSPILSGAVLDSPAYANGPEIYWGDGTGNARAVSEWEYFQHNANTENCPPTIGVEPGSNGDLSFELRARGVNPGRGGCEVMLSLERPSRIEAAVLDVTGRVVATVARDAPLAAGHHMLSWDGRNGVGARAPAGVYFVRVRRDADSRVRKIVLVDGSGLSR